MPSRRLPFTVQLQRHSNWCWAAATSCISKSYNPASPWEQCVIVCDMFRRDDCCFTNIPDECNKMNGLHTALQFTGYLREHGDWRLLPNEVMNEIDLGCVIGVRILWRKGFGHFVTIFGYETRQDDFYVHVADTGIGTTSCIPLRILALNYNPLNRPDNSGRWTHTFHVNRPPRERAFVSGDIDLIAESANLKSFMLEKNTDVLLEGDNNIYNDAISNDVFVICLLTDDNFDDELKIVRTGRSILAKGQNGVDFIYEYDDEDALRQVTYNVSFTSRYKNVLRELEENIRSNSNDFSIRVLRMQELHIEAFWVNFKDREDFVVPIIGNDFVQDNRSYDLDSFQSQILKHVKERQIFDDGLN